MWFPTLEHILEKWLFGKLCEENSYSSTNPEFSFDSGYILTKKATVSDNLSTNMSKKAKNRLRDHSFLLRGEFAEPILHLFWHVCIV